MALRLSELKPGAVQLNTGRKDFMLQSTGEPWKLAHLGPIGADAQDFAQRLMVAEAHLQGTEPSTLLCFAVDKRRQELLAWLSSQGVVSDTSCSSAQSHSFARLCARPIGWMSQPRSFNAAARADHQSESPAQSASIFSMD